MNDRLIINNNAHKAHLGLLDQAICYLRRDQLHQAASCIRRFVALERVRRAERRAITRKRTVKSPHSEQEQELKAHLEMLVRQKTSQEICS